MSAILNQYFKKYKEVYFLPIYLSMNDNMTQMVDFCILWDTNPGPDRQLCHR